jgi:hypothetical protein
LKGKKKVKGNTEKEKKKNKKENKKDTTKKKQEAKIDFFPKDGYNFTSSSKEASQYIHNKLPSKEKKKAQKYVSLYFDQELAEQ